VAEVFTGSPGKYVSLEDTISGFKGILGGKYDDLPEMAFYMVGDIKEVVEKAERMAKEMAERKARDEGKGGASAEASLKDVPPLELMASEVGRCAGRGCGPQARSCSCSTGTPQQGLVDLGTSGLSSPRQRSSPGANPSPTPLTPGQGRDL
jgi:hypothetical protein